MEGRGSAAEAAPAASKRRRVVGMASALGGDVDRWDSPEPFGSGPLDLGGELQQQRLGAEITVELYADRQPVAI